MRMQTIGYEEPILELARFLDTKVHVSKYFYNLYDEASQGARIDSEGSLIKRLVPYLTVNPNESRLHVCKYMDCIGNAWNADVIIYPSTNYSLEVINRANASQTTDLTLYESELLTANHLEQGNNDLIIKLSDNVLYCPEKDTNPILPRQIYFHYSCHSSYGEMRQFVELFSPTTVYPIVQNANYFLNGFNIKSTFGDLCKDDSFLADRELREKLNIPVHLEIDEDCDDLFREIEPAIEVSKPNNDSFLYGIGKQNDMPYKLRQLPSPPLQLSDTQDNDDILTQLYNNTQRTGERTSLSPQDYLDSSPISSPLAIENRPINKPWAEFVPMSAIDSFVPTQEVTPPLDSQITISADQVNQLSEQLRRNPYQWFELSSQLTFREKR